MIDHIWRNLYIGNANDARSRFDLDRLGITSIVNVAHEIDDGWDWESQRRYFKAGIKDGADNSDDHYALAASLVERLLSNKEEKVLLHCYEGRSRSALVATLVIFYMYTYFHEESWSKQQAFDLVCEKRPLCKGMNQYFKDRLKVK